MKFPSLEIHAKVSGPIPVLEMSISRHNSEETEVDERGTCIGVPAGLHQFERKVYDSVVSEQFTTEEPITAVEAREVRSYVSNFPVIIEVREIYVVSNSRSLLGWISWG